MFHLMRILGCSFLMLSCLMAAEPVATAAPAKAKAEARNESTVSTAPATDLKTQEAVAPKGAAGMVVNLDASRATTQEIPSEISDALGRLINTSSDGLTQETLADGKTVVVDLQGRFTSALVARVGSDGKVQTQCFDRAPHKDAEGKTCQHGQKSLEKK